MIELKGIPAQLLSTEKRRGLMTSILSGGVSSGATAVAIAGFGVSPVSAVFALISVLSSLFSYALDILFAKSDFKLKGAKAPAPVPYSHLGVRARWLLRSIWRPPFTRFIIVTIIETVTILAVLRAAVRRLDEREFMTRTPTRRRIRDLALTLLVVSAVFLLFGNILRFDWAYVEVENQQVTIVVLMWMALSVLAFGLHEAGR
jgi:hypothetical protein